MARTDSLTNYLTDLGTALREKTGTSDLIPANTFDTVITNIQTKEDLTTELTTQDNLITNQEITIDNIVNALKGKISGGNEPMNILTNDYSQIGYSGTYIKSNGYTTSNVLWSDLTPYTGQSATWYVTNPIEIEPNTYYKYEGFTSGNNPGACFLGEDGTTIYTGFVYKYKGIFKTPEKAKYIVMTVAAESIETKSVKKLTAAEIKELEIDALIERTLSGDYVNNRVTTIGTEALRATQITGLHCENVTSVGGEAVRQCNYLVNVYLPKCTSLGGYSFGLCPLLEKVELGAITNIKAYDFYNCSKLTILIINNTTSACTLANVNAFNNTPIANGTGYVYVPDDLVNTYKAATNWSTFANQIKGLSELSSPPVPEPDPH